MTSGASATISAAYLRELAASAAPQRMSICTLRPVVQPNDCKVCDERCDMGLPFRIVLCTGHEYADTPHPLGLLRARSKRPCRRTADKTDELAPFHGPLKTHLVQGLKPSILRRSGEREMFRPDVRFGSKADMCSAKAHVRYVPKADIVLPP